jgi:hypothetical protein
VRIGTCKRLILSAPIEYGVADTIVLILEMAVRSVVPRNEAPDLGFVAVDQEPVLKKFMDARLNTTSSGIFYHRIRVDFPLCARGCRLLQCSKSSAI